MTLNSIAADGRLEDAQCPICGDSDSRSPSRGYYFKCSTCKVAFRKRRDTIADLDEYWQKAFWTDLEIQKRKNRAPVFQDAVRLLEDVKPEGGRVLDIGCGIGTFLSICRGRGWSVTGVEPSAIACEVAKREYDLDLINGVFSSDQFQGTKFDAVFAAQVLHHLPDPVSFLMDVDRVLADDGILILRTPNLIPLEPSLVLQGLLDREKGFFCGPALYTFHPDTLSMLLRRTGYRNVAFVNSRPYLEMPQAPWRSIKSLAGAVGCLAVAALKLTTYGMAETLFRASNGSMVVGPSVFVIARR